MKCGLAIERQSTFCYPSFLLLFLVVVEDRKATVKEEKRPFLPLPFSSLLACHVVYRLLTGLTQQWSTRKTIFGWNRVEWHQLRNDKEHDDTCLWVFQLKKSYPSIYSTAGCLWAFNWLLFSQLHSLRGCAKLFSANFQASDVYIGILAPIYKLGDMPYVRCGPFFFFIFSFLLQTSRWVWGLWNYASHCVITSSYCRIKHVVIYLLLFLLLLLSSLTTTKSHLTNAVTWAKMNFQSLFTTLQLPRPVQHPLKLSFCQRSSRCNKKKGSYYQSLILYVFFTAQRQSDYLCFRQLRCELFFFVTKKR